MKILSAFALTLFSPLAVCQSLIFLNGMVPEAPPVAKVMVAYIDIENRGNTDITLNHFISADFSSVELHKTTIEKGIAKMSAQKNLIIPAGKTAELKPGGLHLMLTGPKKPFKHGDLIQLEILQTDKT